MVTVHRHAHMNKSVWYLFSMLSFHINQCDFYFTIIFRTNKSVIYRNFPVRYYVPFQSILQFQSLTLIHETCDPIKCCRGICERNQVYTQNTSRQIDNDLQTNKKKCSTLWFCSWIFQSHRFFSTMFSQYSHDIHLELWIFIANAEKNSNVFFVVLTWSVALTWSSKCNTHKKSLPIKCPNQFDSALSAMVFSIQSKRRVAISIIMKDAATIGAFRYFNTISVDSVSMLALFIQFQKICQNCGSGAIFAGNISF